MLSLPPTVRVFVAAEPLDMRGSFDALAGAVRRLGLDPVDGHLYLFLNKRRKIAKTLWFDGSGWCVLAKRLEPPRSPLHVPLPRLRGAHDAALTALAVRALQGHLRLARLETAARKLVDGDRRNRTESPDPEASRRPQRVSRALPQQ